MQRNTCQLLSAALSLVSMTLAAEDASVNFNIPAQGLTTALRQFADQGHLEILYDGPTVSDKRTTGLTGSYTPKAALQKLLTGSGLDFAFTGQDAVAIKKSPSLAENETNPGPGRVTPLPEMVVTSKAVTPIPLSKVTQNLEAAPASTTVLSRENLSRLSITTYGDIFRKVPGVFVNDYSQGMISYEIKMRGFAGGHSSDINFMIDGVPMNVTGSSHKNGYVDLAVLIPETLDRVEIVRGPFNVAYGNHDVAGSVNFSTFGSMRSMIKVDVDNFGRGRLLPLLSRDLGPGHVLLTGDLVKGPGYADHSDIQRGNIFARYSLPLGDGIASIRAQHYGAEGDAPGYLNLDRIKSGVIKPSSALSAGSGDAKTQTNLVLNYRSNDIDGSSGWNSGWSAALYAVHDVRRRWFNYNADTPLGTDPDLEAEHDKMEQYGVNIQKATMLNDRVQLLVGSQFNSEKVDAMIFTTDAQRRYAGDAGVFAQRALTTRTTSFFGEVQWNPIKPVKVQMGLRWDQLEFGTTVGSRDPNFNGPAGNEFDTSQNQFSPKLGLAWTVQDGDRPVEIFANAARGLKSPYAFGDFNRLQFAEISPLLSYEVGLRGGNAEANWRASGWRTKQDQEALFDGAGQFLGTQKTTRDGFDLEGRTSLTRDIWFNANFSRVFAHIDDAASSRILGQIPNWTAGFGFDGNFATHLGSGEWSVFDTIIGPQPLFADNSRQTHTYHRVVARGAIAPSILKGLKLALATTFYSHQFEETQFDAGGGVIGTAPKPTWQVFLSAQYMF